jgi:hypothetical protein
VKTWFEYMQQYHEHAQRRFNADQAETIAERMRIKKYLAKKDPHWRTCPRCEFTDHYLTGGAHVCLGCGAWLVERGAHK